eukprot:7789586-Pyramimonas_sp.AAC.1
MAPVGSQSRQSNSHLYQTMAEGFRLLSSTFDTCLVRGRIVCAALLFGLVLLPGASSNITLRV